MMEQRHHVRSGPCSPRVSAAAESSRSHPFSFPPLCAFWCFTLSVDDSRRKLSQHWIDCWGNVAVCALSCTMWDLSSPTKDWTPVPCIRRQILDDKQDPSKWVLRKIQENVRGIRYKASRGHRERRAGVEKSLVLQSARLIPEASSRNYGHWGVCPFDLNS